MSSRTTGTGAWWRWSCSTACTSAQCTRTGEQVCFHVVLNTLLQPSFWGGCGFMRWGWYCLQCVCFTLVWILKSVAGYFPSGLRTISYYLCECVCSLFISISSRWLKSTSVGDTVCFQLVWPFKWKNYRIISNATKNIASETSLCLRCIVILDCSCLVLFWECSVVDAWSSLTFKY